MHIRSAVRSAVLAFCMTSLTGCTALAVDPTPVHGADDSTTATSRATSKPSEPVPVTPNPPVRYDPAGTLPVVKNAAGYLVDSCVPKQLRDHAIALTASDGVHLSGLVLGSGSRGVLLQHERGYNVCSFLPLAEQLAARGYLVVLPEFRDHGASQKVADDGRLDRDTRAGLRELQRRGARSIFVGGASCGGTTSALVGATVPHLVGLLNMSSPVDCGPLHSIPALRKITAPSLFIVSPGDMDGAVERQVRKGYAADASKQKTLLIDPSGYHGTDIFREAPHGDRLQGQVLDFILQAFASVR